MSNHFSEVAGATNQHRSCFRRKFNVVHKCANGNFPKRKAITRKKRRVRSNNKRTPGVYLLRQNDISAFAVAIDRKPDECGTERIIFNRLNLRWNILLIVRKVHIAETALVSAALVARRNTPKSISTAFASTFLHQGLMRSIAREELSVRQCGHKATTLGSWFVGFHNKKLPKLNGVPFIQADIGLMTRGARADSAFGAHRLLLAREIHDSYLTRFNLVDFFNSARNLCFRCA